MNYLGIIFVLTILSATFAEEQNSSERSNAQNVNNVPAMSGDDGKDPLNNNQKMTAPRVCKPAICSRIYRPVCGLVDGIPLTAPTMCHFKDKERCLREILYDGEKMPVFRLLHEGPCTDADPNILKTVQKQKRPGMGNRRRPNKPANRPI